MIPCMCKHFGTERYIPTFSHPKVGMPLFPAKGGNVPLLSFVEKFLQSFFFPHITMQPNDNKKKVHWT